MLSIAYSLPRYPKDLSVVIVSMKGKDNNFKHVTVRRQKVADAINWLIDNNQHYKDVSVNLDSLNKLPDCGIPSDLKSIETDDTEQHNSSTAHVDLLNDDADDVVYSEGTEMSSFLPIPQKQQQEIIAVQQQLSQIEQPTMSWPKVDHSNPINEYVTPYLATMAFPTLFPDGNGDPTNPSLVRDVSLAERVKHLLKFAENKNGKWLYRFASHPRFGYWAFNMIQRKRILQQTGIFLKQNPGEAHLSTEELKEMAASNDSNVFLSKISRYVSNITGSNAHWHKAKENLKAIITKEPQHSFLHFRLLICTGQNYTHFSAVQPTTIGNSSETKRRNVINNPHITDWFFTQRLETFIKYWLYKSLDAEWHWHRFEYQARGSIHCHGVAKLKNDPGLCKLSEIALKGHLAEVSLQTCQQGDTEELNLQIVEGKTASKKIGDYVDWLLSTYNPNPPDNGIWVKPSIHPCQKAHSGITAEECDDDYVDLLNTVQRHTRCSTNYCLKKKQDNNLKCRFNFPFEDCESTKARV